MIGTCDTSPTHLRCRLAWPVLQVQESMRVLPVSADGTALEVPRPIQLGGYTIPAK